jgi:hypothetical protein
VQCTLSTNDTLNSLTRNSQPIEPTRWEIFRPSEAERISALAVEALTEQKEEKELHVLCKSPSAGEVLTLTASRGGYCGRCADGRGAEGLVRGTVGR